MVAVTLKKNLLAVVEVKLLLKYIKAGLPAVDEAPSDDNERPLAFAY